MISSPYGINFTMVTEKSAENSGEDELGIQALVESLRSEIFAAQKISGGSVPNLQSLTSSIALVYSALDGFRSEATNAVSAGGSDKGSSLVIASNRKLSYRIHINSIVQSMYTLFCRVLLPSPAKGVDSLHAPIAIPSSFIITDSDGKNIPNGARGYEVAESAISISSKKLVFTDDYLPLRIQSLGLLSSVATYDPGMVEESRISVALMHALFIKQCTNCLYIDSFVPDT